MKCVSLGAKAGEVGAPAWMAVKGRARIWVVFWVWSTCFFALQIPLTNWLSFLICWLNSCGNYPSTDKMQARFEVSQCCQRKGLLRNGWLWCLHATLERDVSSELGFRSVHLCGGERHRELRKNCRSGNCGFRESRGGGTGRKRLGREVEGSFSGNLAEGLGPEQRANFQDHFPGDKGSENGSYGLGRKCGATVSSADIHVKIGLAETHVLGVQILALLTWGAQFSIMMRMRMTAILWAFPMSW